MTTTALSSRFLHLEARLALIEDRFDVLGRALRRLISGARLGFELVALWVIVFFLSTYYQNTHKGET